MSNSAPNEDGDKSEVLAVLQIWWPEAVNGRFVNDFAGKKVLHPSRRIPFAKLGFYGVNEREQLREFIRLVGRTMQIDVVDGNVRPICELWETLNAHKIRYQFFEKGQEPFLFVSTGEIGNA